MGTLSFEPLIAPALWVTLAVAAAGLLGWYGWNRPQAVPRRRWAGILALMAMGLALVLIILLNPTWVEPLTPPSGKPLLTILVDSTASMATPDADNGRTRFQSASQLVQACAAELSDKFEVKVFSFAGSASPVDAKELASRQPQGQITDLAAAVAAGLEEDRSQGQAILLLSDGIHNGGGGAARVLDAVRLAKAKACPVYTRTLGGDADVRDLALEMRSPQELAFVGQKVAATAILRQRGLNDAKTKVTLLRDGKEVETRDVALGAQPVSEVRFEISQPKPGLYRYEIRVEPLPGEMSTVNNSAPLLLRVVDKPVRLLLLEGKPYWDAKFLVRTLMQDASLELESVVRVSENRYIRRSLTHSALTGDPPKTKVQDEWKVLDTASDLSSVLEKLSSYQIVVLGRDADRYLTDAMMDKLRAWIGREGGALVCYRGQPTAQMNQRLAQLLPLRWTPTREERFRVNLTERGQDLRWFPAASPGTGDEPLGNLPTLASTGRAEQPKPLAVVVATARGQAPEAESPAVTYQPYGSGRVVVVEGAGMWRWAFLPPQQQQLDEVYRSLWHSLLRWLVSGADLLPGQQMALRSDKISFSTFEPAAAMLVMREESLKGPTPRIELRGEDGKVVQTATAAPLGDEPGSFRVMFGRLPEGRYQARVAGAPETDPATTAVFDVRSLFEEQLDLKARPDLMARIAEISGGSVLTGDKPGIIAAEFQRYSEQSRPQRIRRLSAWDRWWVLLAVFAVWGAAWAVRRSGGLV